jgi:predicted PurR-regulated permease PerM
VTIGDRQQLWFWVGALALLFLLIYFLSPILLPFVAGSLIAYFLSPVVTWLDRRGMRRSFGAIAVLLVFLLGLLLIGALLLPLVELQVAELTRRLPVLVGEARDGIEHLMQIAEERLGPEDVAKLRDIMASGAADLASWAGRLVQNLLTSGIALANLLLLIFVTPIVAFFMLRDWDNMIALLDSWMPRHHLPVIREQARLIDAALSGFIRGQLLVCLGVGLYYAVALTAIRLEFGLILGILAGILTFIPYVGFTTGFVLALGLALVQFGSGSGLLWVLGVFAVGQVLEANVLAPKLVGERVHLHPVWVIFALLAFGTVFGFLGVLLALPAAAVIGVLVRFALRRYLASPVYDPANRPLPPD